MRSCVWREEARTVDRYAFDGVAGDGAIYRLDPRAKLAAAAALSIVTLKGGPSLLAVVSLGTVITTLGARLGAGRLYRSSRPALPFIGIIFLFHALFSGGQPLPGLALGPVNVGVPGLLQGGLLSWRFALLLFVGSLLTLTTSPPELTSGLERLLRPVCRRGVSSQDLALMVSLALRFVPTLEEEMESIREAQAARGAGFGGGLQRRVRAVCNLALPLSLALFRRCDCLIEAMYARGYQGGPRTGLRGELAFSTVDKAAVALSLAAGIACFLL
jgi:biotin transport system permease protein/energy-coupling factor transport system permease protein